MRTLLIVIMVLVITVVVVMMIMEMMIRRTMLLALGVEGHHTNVVFVATPAGQAHGSTTSSTERTRSS